MRHLLRLDDLINRMVMMTSWKGVKICLWHLGVGVALPQADLHPFRSEEHTSELQSHLNLVCRLLLEKKKKTPHSRAHFILRCALRLGGLADDPRALPAPQRLRRTPRYLHARRRATRLSVCRSGVVRR